MEQVNSAIEAGSQDWIWILNIEGDICVLGGYVQVVHAWVIYLMIKCPGEN